VKGDQPAFLVFAGGHVLKHLYQDLPEGGATLAAAALSVLGPVEVVHFGVGLVLALGVALGIAGAGFRTVADGCGHGAP